MIYNDGRAGFLTTIVGPMFSEKSGELVKRCLLAERYQKKNVVVYKPALDDRYSTDEVVSRIGLRIAARQLNTALDAVDLEVEIYAPCRDADMVAFDEAQFFSSELVGIVERLLCEGRHVIVAGLNLDYLGRPFGPMGKLLLFSDEVEVKSAFCACCGRPAMYSQRLINGQPVTVLDRPEDIVRVGDAETYEPRCRLCFVGRWAALNNQSSRTERRQQI